MKLKKYRLYIIAFVIALVLSGGLWYLFTHKHLGIANTSSSEYKDKAENPNKHLGVLEPVVDAYNAGRYKEAEKEAQRVIDSLSKSRDEVKRKQALSARYLYAFSAARRKDLKTARERFAELKEAAKLQDKHPDELQPSTNDPTFEEQAAFQHAVCTAALGDKKAAEAEYIKVMQDYPESPLIHTAVKRIEVLHDGHLPSYAEAVWTQASKIADARQQAKNKQYEMKQSMCGPECLSKLLKHWNVSVDPKVLAKEMKTSQMGTTLFALADAAKRRGLNAKGYSLTQKGLQKQPLPLIALIQPGHYVVVNSIELNQITYWDPNGKGLGKPSTKEMPIKEWKQSWSGVALVVKKKPSDK